MKPRQSDAYSVNSNFQGEQKDLSVDLASVPHLMRILTNLYSDPILAVIREYSTNALDSHVEADNSAPIEVFLPTALRPTFTVQDYGVGLSERELLEIYSKYGASTKRESDEVVGMLGLGCKSALAYTDQFFIRAVKDGIKTNAIIGRNKHGGGMIQIADEPSPTNEPNGVKISVPVKDAQEFINKAHDFFQWWEPGTVVIDGSLTSPPGDGIKLDETFTLYKAQQQRALDYAYDRAYMRDVIVMGNVPYPLKDRMISGSLSRGQYVIARVPIGTVDPTPAREALEYNDRTTANIKTIKDQFHESIRKYAENEISQASSPSQALMAKLRWQQDAGQLQLRINYKGKEIPTTFDVSGNNISFYTPGSGGSRYSPYGGGQGQIDVRTLQNHTIVVGFDKEEFDNSRDRLKLRTWASNHKVHQQRFMVCEKMPGSPWTDEFDYYNWEVIKHTSVDDTKAAPRQKKGGIKVVVPTNFPDKQLKTQDITEMPDNIKKLLVSPAAEVQPFEIARLFPDCAVVILGRNRWDKFKRDYSEVVEASTAVMERIETIEAKLDDDAFLRAAQFPPFEQRFFNVDYSRIDDPKLKRWFKLQDTQDDLSKDVKQLLDDLRHLTLTYKQCDLNEREARRINRRSLYNLPFAMRDSVAELVDHVKVRYPFLKFARRGELGDHEYEYVNAMFAHYKTKPKVKVTETTETRVKAKVKEGTANK